MFQSNVPFEFWGECVLTAVYLINRIPTPLLSNKSPVEVLYNCPPSLAYLRVFGCDCYATNVHPKQKFNHRASICVFMLYPHGQKGYKLFDLQAKKISISRDVYFQENVFPFHSKYFQFPQNSSPYFPLPHNISYDTPIQSISSIDFSPNSTLPLLDHNPKSPTSSSDVVIPESSSLETTIPSSSHSPLPTMSSSSPSAMSEPSNPSPISTLDEPPIHCSSRHIQPHAW